MKAKHNDRPPRFLIAFFRWFCDPHLVSPIEGDLTELFYERLQRSGRSIATLSVFLDILLLMRPGIIRPLEVFNPEKRFAMFKNYFVTGIRNILKYKVFSFINVFGLALAMSVCMLIILMLADQRRYDDFHIKKDRIYRLGSSYQNSRGGYATTAVPVAKVLKEEYPAIEDVTALSPGPGGEATWNDHVVEIRGYFADPSFFNVFDFRLTSGDPRTALTQARSVVLSSTAAAKLFGHENPIGKVIDFSDRQLPFPQEYGAVNSKPVPWGSFTVTGVIDEQHYKSHLHYDVLMSSSTLPQLVTEKKWPDRTNDWEFFYQTYTYALIHEGKNRDDLNAALNSISDHHYSGISNEELKGFRVEAQLLSEVQTDLKGNDTNNRLPRIGYYFLIILAAVIMISACLNYTNLSIARALTRAKEIGVRKVTGAFKKDLLIQFLSESIITTFLAMGLGILMLLLIKPAFRGLWVNQYLNFELPDTFGVYGIFIAFAVVIGSLAGIYPAVKLAGYQPIRALKNQENKKRGGLGMRKVLSVSQFVISLFFITTSILIFRQFKYFLEFDYGFRSSNVINVEMQGASYDKLRTAFSTLPDVLSVTASDIVPSTGRNNGTEIKKPGAPEDYTSVGMLITDENFISALDIPLIAGRPLPAATADTIGHFILVNRALAKQFGFTNPAEMIGTVLENKWGKELFEVVGVTEDFRFNLLINRRDVDPLVMRNIPNNFANAGLKINSEDMQGTIARLEKKWKEVDPLHPFKYRFYDEQIAATHKGIFDLVSILGFIALLAVTIACLGLLGMATYTAERRKKEVGIRKVLGADDFGIVVILSREFLKIVILSVLIAAPLSYFVNNLWLETLPTRVGFGYQTVLIGTLIMVMLGMVTIGSQTFKAARTSPVDALKSE